MNNELFQVKIVYRVAQIKKNTDFDIIHKYII